MATRDTYATERASHTIQQKRLKVVCFDLSQKGLTETRNDLSEPVSQPQTSRRHKILLVSPKRHLPTNVHPLVHFCKVERQASFKQGSKTDRMMTASAQSIESVERILKTDQIKDKIDLLKSPRQPAVMPQLASGGDRVSLLQPLMAYCKSNEYLY